MRATGVRRHAPVRRREHPLSEFLIGACAVAAIVVGVSEPAATTPARSAGVQKIYGLPPIPEPRTWFSNDTVDPKPRYNNASGYP